MRSVSAIQVYLAPVAPGEATLEETTLAGAFTFDFSVLAPVTPGEADFLMLFPEKNIDLTILAPVTPAEADFNDNIEVQALISARSKHPSHSAEADFE